MTARISAAFFVLLTAGLVQAQEVQKLPEQAENARQALAATFAELQRCGKQDIDWIGAAPVRGLLAKDEVFSSCSANFRWPGGLPRA